MHDGTALSLTDAIRQHRKTAERSQRAFERLGQAEKAALLAFLSSL